MPVTLLHLIPPLKEGTEDLILLGFSLETYHSISGSVNP